MGRSLLLLISILIAAIACGSSSSQKCICQPEGIACGAEACIGGRSFSCTTYGSLLENGPCADATEAGPDAGAGCALGRPPKSSDCCSSYVLENNGWCSPACDPVHPCPMGYGCTPSSTKDAGVCTPECSTDSECRSPVQWATCDRDLGVCSN